jgi:hypothetical protein
MDTFLANYFGTNQNAPEPTAGVDDLEKMAQLVMLDKIAGAKNIDLSNLSDEEYVKLAAQVFSGQPTPAPAEPSSDMPEHEKIARARFEEAKFLGQVVAHSMWNELDSIQKHAMAKAAQDEEENGNGNGNGNGKAPPFPPKKKEEDMEDEEENGNGEKSKEGSAFDALSDARAYEILQQYGLADGEGNVVSAAELNKHAQAVYAQQQGQLPTEKTAADRLAEAVEQQAWEKLAGAGYDPRVINYLLQVQQANQGQ